MLAGSTNHLAVLASGAGYMNNEQQDRRLSIGPGLGLTETGNNNDEHNDNQLGSPRFHQ